MALVAADPHPVLASIASSLAVIPARDCYVPFLSLPHSIRILPSPPSCILAHQKRVSKTGNEDGEATPWLFIPAARGAGLQTLMQSLFRLNSDEAKSAKNRPPRSISPAILPRKVEKWAHINEEYPRDIKSPFFKSQVLVA